MDKFFYMTMSLYHATSMDLIPPRDQTLASLTTTHPPDNSFSPFLISDSREQKLGDFQNVTERMAHIRRESIVIYYASSER